mmetsp:Transcript_73543/g.127598  ORF Transcript_73543/g.127598 Transcript_73543/m.127598 type:complete len:82 (-) Transcript_73543:1059-1304(-)
MHPAVMKAAKARLEPVENSLPAPSAGSAAVAPLVGGPKLAGATVTRPKEAVLPLAPPTAEYSTVEQLQAAQRHAEVAGALH